MNLWNFNRRQTLNYQQLKLLLSLNHQINIKKGKQHLEKCLSNFFRRIRIIKSLILKMIISLVMLMLLLAFFSLKCTKNHLLPLILATKNNALWSPKIKVILSIYSKILALKKMTKPKYNRCLIQILRTKTILMKEWFQLTKQRRHY